MMIKKLLIGGFLLTFSQLSLAANIGIIDSGTDMKHPEIAPWAWSNQLEVGQNGEDDDGNGLIDDIFGWNYAEDNNQVIDYSFLGRFDQDVYTFFKIQAKMVDGQASSSEILWMKEKLGIQAFQKDLMTFGNFIHGTHVAGISIKEASLNNKVLAVKIIPTEVKLPEEGDSDVPSELEQRLEAMARGRSERERQALLKAVLAQISVQQMDLLRKVATYLNEKKTDVANGSFGTGYKQVAGLVGMFFKPIMGRPAEESDLRKLTLFFFENLLNEGKSAMQLAPNTLFVYAAGNESENNDLFPTSPANIDTPNTISVAATYGQEKLAKFSNYGKEMVDIAAPGVSIDSAIPGDDHLALSGTSQAAPYVTNVAGQMKNIAPDLSPLSIKRILMKTADVKSFLKDKVTCSGIVNRERAIRAASLTREHSLSTAITMAKSQVMDNKSFGSDNKSFNIPQPGAFDFVLPLPSDLPTVR